MNSWSRVMPTIGQRRWALAAGVLCWLGPFNELGTKAWAQAQRSDNPATPGQLYLTGDWGGTRSYLERLGVTFTFSYTNDLLANVSGGIKTGAVAIGIFQPQVDLDLQKLLGWEGDRIHIHGLVTHGPFFSANYLAREGGHSIFSDHPPARVISERWASVDIENWFALTRETV